MGNEVYRYGKAKAPYAERETTYGPEGNKTTVITPKGGAEGSRVSPGKQASKQAKSDAQLMDWNYEQAKTDYDKYKQTKDPSSEKLTSRLRKGDVKAEATLNRSLRAADDAKLAGYEETKNRLSSAAAPKPGEYNFKKGGVVKSSASSRGDGCAQRGKTRGKWV